jgi:glycosyltransferase involved in cell wall biosynthesis
MEHMHFSLVLPCFNEEENAERAIRDVLSWFDARHIQGELIAVNDGSKDRTGVILQRLASEDPRVKVVTHEKNQGYGAAIRSGLDTARMETMGFMDSDGQFKAKDLELLLPHLDTYAFVTGRRRKRADPFMRGLFGKILGVMNLIALGLWVRDVNCGLKVMRKSIWPQIRPTYGIEKLFNTELFLHLKEQGISWYTVDVPHYPRKFGNPTGAKWYVIKRMFQELQGLRKAQRAEWKEKQHRQ